LSLPEELFALQVQASVALHGLNAFLALTFQLKVKQKGSCMLGLNLEIVS
jgi:hypothetical protein